MKKIIRVNLLIATLIASFGVMGSSIDSAAATTDSTSPPESAPASSTAGTSASSTPTSSSAAFKPLWSGKNADSGNWTTYAEDALETYGDNLLKGPSDVESFCPMYSRLGHQDQVNFWVQLLAGVAEYESGFNPVSYMIETTMGKDPITGSQVISAGLFQLSYQDTPNYKHLLPAGLCVFDYAADSKLSMKDIRRTIYDPKNNITCAVAIMNFIAGRHGAIAINSGNYWSTLMPASKYGRVPQIKALTKKLAFCNN